MRCCRLSDVCATAVKEVECKRRIQIEEGVGVVARQTRFTAKAGWMKTAEGEEAGIRSRLIVCKKAKRRAIDSRPA